MRRFFCFSRFCSKAQSEKITIETITINSSVFYGITDVFTRIESLYPTFVLTRVNLPDVAVTVARSGPRHVHALVDTLSLEDARPVATPFPRDPTLCAS